METIPSYAPLEKDSAESFVELANYRLMHSSVNVYHPKLQNYHEMCKCFMLDKDAIITEVNNEFSDFFGYDREEIIGLCFIYLLAINNYKTDTYLNKIYYYLTSKNFYQLEDNIVGDKSFVNIVFNHSDRTISLNDVVLTAKTKDGNTATINLQSILFYDDHGDFIQTQCMLMDIAEFAKIEKALRKSEQEKALILGAMLERVIYHDTERRIGWANHIAAETAGLPLGRLIGSFCFEVYHNCSTPCENCPAMMVFETKSSQKGQMQTNGKILEITAHPVHDERNHFVGVVQVAVDITERKQLEQKLLYLSTNERHRISRDLHDGMGQHLTSISFLATALSNQLADVRPEIADTAALIVKSVDSALKNLRMILLGLCPIPFGDKGLVSALSTLATNTANIYHMDCRFSCDAPTDIFNQAATNNLFHITQEAVNNAAKHSGCTSIRIVLEQRHDMVELRIHDNGTWLTQKRDTRQGMGLQTMRFRASMIGASFKISRITGMGTTISCQIPTSILRKKES
jgi:signal transduction histidine kinase